MRFKFSKVLLSAFIIVFSCSVAFALSDAEYLQMMKDASFAKADKALTKAWKDAQRKLVKNKTALANLRKDQREWVARGRDSDAEDLMDIEGYGRLKAYTVATNTRAEYLYELADKYLEESGAPAKNARSASQNSQNTARPQTQNKKNNKTAIEYPTLGMCTGNSVRLRDNPGTDSNIMGRANDMDILILLGERKVNGDTWYAVDNPTDEGTVWISGQFVDVYKGDYSDTPAYKMGLEVRMNYGIKPEKARAMLSEPDKVTHDTFFFDSAGRELNEDTYEYTGCTLRYVEGRLRHVEVFKEGFNFGNVFIGDSRDKLIKTLGNPADGMDAESITYEISPIEALLFEFEDDAIVRMTWDEYMDG